MTPLEINKKIAKLKNIIAYQDNWAEDIGDAWELFEEMEGGRLLCKSITRCDGFQVWQINEDGYGMSVVGEGLTAQIAICKSYIYWKTGKAVE